MLKGMIIAWYGSLETIPDGWVLCDGDNGTPDLHRKFIRGAGVILAPGTTGGTNTHTHDFTGDGHTHVIDKPGVLEGGHPAYAYEIQIESVTGTTDLVNHLPTYHALCYIMKIYDDPDPRSDLPWPYASKAIIQHTYQNSILQIWITFRFTMNTDNKPADGLWLVEADGVPEAIDSSAWVDPWTMLLTIDPLVGAPAEVTVEYDGPDQLLATRWDKQWEPWGPIQSVEIPTPPETKTLSTGPAPQDDVDVSGITTLFLECSSNDITIGAFVGGVNGQVLHICRLCEAVNDATLEHNELTANQNIFLHKGLDETLTGEYGGWLLACNGTNWYDISHAKHV